MNEDLLKLLSRDTYGFPSNTSVYDADGRELRLFSLDEKLVAPFGENSYRKACHWAWEILSMMVKKCAVPSKLGKLTAFLEASPMNLLENTLSPRVLNSHLWWDYLPRQLAEKKTKIVLTYRNPKDTAVSYYHHIVSLFDLYKYDGTFKNWFPLYMEGQIDYESYFDYFLEWDQVIKSNPDHPIFVVSYEDMKEDLPTVMKRMSAFLDLDLDDQLLAEIAKAAGFDAMKTTYNQSQSLSKALMRKGQFGDWKNCLTVAQSEAVDVDKAMKNLEGTLFSGQNQKYTL